MYKHLNSMATSSQIVIGYWRGRGLVSPIKLMLEYLQLPYKEITHECGPPPDFGKVDWYKEKKSILKGFAFPNLPYYKDADVSMTHCDAIMEYLGNKHDLYPKDIGHAAMLREQIKDIMQLLVDYCYFPQHRRNGTTPSIEEKKDSREVFIETTKIKLEELSDSYHDGCWFVDNKLTYIDFLLYNYLECIRIITPEIFPKHLEKFMKLFESQPTLKSYLTSERYCSFPFWPDRSYIGRRKDDWLDHC